MLVSVPNRRRQGRMLVLGGWICLSLMGEMRNLYQSTMMEQASNWSMSTENPENFIDKVERKNPSGGAIEGWNTETTAGRNDALSTLSYSGINPTAPHVIQWTGLGKRNSFSYFIRKYWERNVFCETIQEHRRKHNLATPTTSKTASSTTPLIHMQVSMNCPELVRNLGLGTGNILTAIYGLRWAAFNQGVYLHIDCHNSKDIDYQHYIIPWVTGSFPPRSDSDTEDDDPHQQVTMTKSVSSFCSTYNKQPIGYLVPDMIRELRRMALALAGTSNIIPLSSTTLGQKVSSWAKEHFSLEDHHVAVFLNRSLPLQNNNSPLETTSLPQPEKVFSNIQLDDAVIHFRCGDLMSQYAHKSYGFLTFPAYAQFISPQARRIGILTQPFRQHNKAPLGSTRVVDRIDESGPRCEIVVNAFVQYLRERFPNTTHITIHNHEPLPLSYARIILANQSISAMSSFPVFAQVASFGQAFVRRPGNPSGPYQWVDHFPSMTRHCHTNQDSHESTNPLVLFESRQVIPSQWIARLWSPSSSPTQKKKTTVVHHPSLLPLFRGEYNLTRILEMSSKQRSFAKKAAVSQQHHHHSY